MINTKQKKNTNLIELVETHNLANAILRLKSAPGYQSKWERSLYHALAMAFVDAGMLERIRIALRLP